MKQNWLKERLTKAKQDSNLWGAFTDAIQDVWNELIEPILERISNRKSFFTMDSEDMDTRISEYGRFFIIEEKEKSRRPMLLTQRLDEVHFKGTYRPIEQTFWREFGETPISWEPLYAPVNQVNYPYGSILLTSEQVSGADPDYGDFFLTSRGRVVLNMNQLAESDGAGVTDDAINTMQAQFLNIVAPLLPLHIVFDGLTLQLVTEINVEDDDVFYWQGETVAETEISFAQADDKLKAYFVTGDSVTDAVVFASRTRSFDSIPICIDTMPLDAWSLDVTAIIPLIIPGLNEDDPRIYEKSDGALMLRTLGQWGCLVEYENGSLQQYGFPGGSEAVVLQSTAGSWRSTIRSISYIAGVPIASTQSAKYDGSLRYDGTVSYSG